MKKHLALFSKRIDVVTLTDDDITLLSDLFESFPKTDALQEHLEQPETDEGFQAFLDRLDKRQAFLNLLSEFHQEGKEVPEDLPGKIEARDVPETSFQDILLILHTMLKAMENEEIAKHYAGNSIVAHPTIELLRMATLATTIGYSIGVHSVDPDHPALLPNKHYVLCYNKMVPEKHKLGLKDYGLLERRAYYLLGYLSHPKPSLESPFLEPIDNLLVAAIEEDVALLNTALKDGAPVNERSADSSKSALDYAAMHGNLDIIQRLLEIPGIKITPDNNEIHSPLYLAIIFQKRAAAVWLLEARAKLSPIDHNDRNRETLLANAMELGLRDSIRPLIRAGRLNEEPRNQGTSCFQFFSCWPRRHVQVEGARNSSSLRTENSLGSVHK